LDFEGVLIDLGVTAASEQLALGFAAGLAEAAGLQQNQLVLWQKRVAAEACC
jgi:hypothetical protein